MMNDQAMAWTGRAACRTETPDLFFPIGGSTPAGDVATAKAICARCPVRRDCLDYALATRQRHGIWGGMTEDDRDTRVRSDLRRRRSAARSA
jgi:WhiB family redox-sensing transcriptional regulator